MYTIAILGGPVFLEGTRNSNPFPQSVSEAWMASLPKDKNDVFEGVVRQWDCLYAMLSVALDESFSLRARGELIFARQQVTLSGKVLDRLGKMLVAACDILADRGRRLEDVPPVESMKTTFFRGDAGQSAASRNEILHVILPTNRLRFFLKMRLLSDAIERVTTEFRKTASDLADGTAEDPDAAWRLLECLHYDFNTCLRESEVMFKSFLVALRTENLADFSSALFAKRASWPLRLRPRLSRASA